MGDRKKGDPGRRGPSLDESGILIEFHRVGNAVKVTAVDPQSLLEASIVGDPAMGEAALSHAAIRKLRYVLDRRGRKQGEGGQAGDGAAAGSAPPRRGGTLV